MARKQKITKRFNELTEGEQRFFNAYINAVASMTGGKRLGKWTSENRPSLKDWINFSLTADDDENT